MGVKTHIVMTSCLCCRENEEKEKCSIPGLEGRQLEFLGLFGCAYNACNRKDIPAKRVRPLSYRSRIICLRPLKKIKNMWFCKRGVSWSGVHGSRKGTVFF